MWYVVRVGRCVSDCVCSESICMHALCSEYVSSGSSRSHTVLHYAYCAVDMVPYHDKTYN